MSLNLGCVGKPFGPYSFEYEHNDVILYALGVGASAEELQYVYEGDPRFCVLPTFAVIPATRALFGAVGELDADLTRLLHGEQAIRFFAPIPVAAKLATTWKVNAVYDKGKGALAILTALSSDEKGTPVFENTISLFIRGEGGFGGDRGPEQGRIDPPADMSPDLWNECVTARTQALLYRLNGDANPLHASPEFAAVAGFERPILHGLCTLGVAVRAFVTGAMDGNPSRVKSLSARFTGVVYPGDTITTEGWKVDDGRWILKARTNRGVVAISNFVMEAA